MKEQKLSPFCHTFEAGGIPYVYDVNTNQILAAEPELAAVLPLFGIHSADEIVGLLPDLAAARVREACAAIARAQREDGLFLPMTTRIAPPDPGAWAAGTCDTGLQHLVLTVTEACNLRCTYCMHTSDLGWVRTHGTEAMSKETALESVRYFLDRARTGHAPAISFYGGEALLQPGLIGEVMAFARAHPRGDEVVFAVDTNGVLMTDAVIDLLVAYEAHLQISLDGTREQHDRCRVDAGGGGTFDTIMDAVGRLLRADRSAADRLSFIMTLAPPADLFEVAAFFADFAPYREHGIEHPPRLKVNFANLRGIDWENEGEGFRAMARQLEEMRDLYVEAVAAGTREALNPVIKSLFDGEVIRFHHRSRAALGGTFTPGGNCDPGKRKLHVMPDGSFHPCERTGANFAIGNLVEGIQPQGVKTIQERFHAAVQDRCGACWALRHCGVCYAVQAEHSARPTDGFPVPEEVCDQVRHAKEQTLQMMARLLELPPERLAWLDDTVTA
jgi:uncharacterized protein